MTFPNKKNTYAREFWCFVLQDTHQWPAKGFAPQLSKIPPCHCKNNLIHSNEILVQKTDNRWHGSYKASKLDICGLTLVPPLNTITYKDMIGRCHYSLMIE